MASPLERETMTEADSTNKKMRLDKLPEKLRAKIIEQGVAETANLEHIYGAGEDLWESEEEFEQFLNYIAQSRREGG
jgi:hypothetical protein